MVGIADMLPGGRLTAGEVFADYVIVRFLGSGGMGEVYLAEHPRLPRREALKILRNIPDNDVSADDEYRRRFIREADLTAGLWHPNIVRVNDRGEFNGQLWLAMDFVDGSDAATLVREHYPVGMPADQVAPILSAIARALDYAHEHHGLMHRDVSPANILLTKPQDEEQRILLSDFGIARNVCDTSGLTATNMTIGTFPYAAPEQLTDEPLDGRADQYALAASVYHLLTGSPLFPHTNPAVVIGRHLTAPPPRLAETHPMLRVFDPVLAVALAKDPADRFARCTDFAEAFIRAAKSGRHPATSVSTMPRPLAIKPAKSTASSSDADVDLPQRRRSRWGVLAAASAAIGLAALGASGSHPDASRAAAGQNASSVAPTVAAPPPHEVADAAPAAPQAAPALPSALPAPAAVPAAPAPKGPAPTPRAPAPPPPAPASRPPAAVPQPPASPDQTYLNLVSGIPGVTVTDPSVAVATGRNLCTVLQNGGSPSEVANATVNNNEGITPAQAAAGVNAAITVYCPQYQR
ncbi:serine/threonine-protein kinase [Mycobacterium vicinigordonae]|uniref:non-specific serine/threonine protein kinase n=1 Tax=Mycobacterium vicinigordonae TaxID=1719132 RepID=A0A7D6DYM7_9MYCO|nr:serine/threonine-protein kinase [Mycobacterium vicinigordonae]QLL06929.1 protein kinase [Mycobacterium vicinigordonae]